MLSPEQKVILRYMLYMRILRLRLKKGLEFDTCAKRNARKNIFLFSSGTSFLSFCFPLYTSYNVRKITEVRNEEAKDQT